MIRFSDYRFRNIVIFFFLIIATGNNSFLIAQADSTKKLEFFKLTIEDLLKKTEERPIEQSVKIATQTIIPLRESPGIITIISKEDIEDSGAQDLMELLQLVPGIDFGSDVQNVIGMSVRGNWAFEGKVLITIDGQMVNETGYGSFAFAQRIFTDNIEKVEIIRGPGSAIYGGVAGLAVINIITKTGKDIQGITSSHSISFANGLSRKISQFQVGEIFKNDLTFYLSGVYNEGNLSNRTITTSDQSIINYKDSSQIRSYFLNTGIQYKNFDVRYIFNDYSSNIIESQGSTRFGGHYLNAQYLIPLNPNIRIIPHFLFSSHAPWDLKDVPENNYNATNTRYTGRIQLLYEPNKFFSVISGIENFYDKSKITTPITESEFNNGKSYLAFNNLALYNQAILKTHIVNLTLGVRMDSHSAFGVAFAPRLGITKILNDWHIKLLYSNAYKAPTLQNLNANPAIEPERIHTSEFELGYQVNPGTMVTANIFNIKINNNIIYEAIDNIIDHYVNGDESGSAGGEVSYVGKFNWGSIKTNYSYYFTTYNISDEIDQPGLTMRPIFPAHKALLITDYKINRHLFINSSFLFFSKKNTYIRLNDESQLVTLNSTLQGNASIKYKNMFFKGLDGKILINNIFNSNYNLVHPYETEENPIPSQSREIVFKLFFTFKK